MHSCPRMNEESGIPKPDDILLGYGKDIDSLIWSPGKSYTEGMSNGKAGLECNPHHTKWTEQ